MDYEKAAENWLKNCSDHRGEQILSLAELLAVCANEALEKLTGYELAGCCDRAGMVARVCIRDGSKLPLASDWDKFADEVRRKLKAEG